MAGRIPPMQTLRPQEHRNAFRWKVAKNGKLIVPGQSCAIDVAFRDLSISGARVAIPIEVSLPADFDIAIPAEGFRCAARIRWRSKDEIGLQLVGPPHQVPVAEADDLVDEECGALAVAPSQPMAGLGHGKLTDFNKFKVHPEFRFGHQPDPIYADRGHLLVEVHLRNISGFEAHQPFICLPLLGLTYLPAAGWDTQDVAGVRKMRRFARLDVCSLARTEATHCCTISLPLRTSNGGELEYEAGHRHAIRDLPDLKLTCVAGAGNFPSNPIPLIVPALEITAALAHLAATGRIPRLMAVPELEYSSIQSH